MSKSCFKIREHLLDHHFDELDGLEKERVQAHLDNCEACRGVVDRLGNAFTAAADWEPQIKEGEVDRLMERLTPYLEQPSEEKSYGWIFGAGLALAAGIALVLVLGSPFSRTPSAPAQPKMAKTSKKLIKEVERKQATDHLRVVSSSDWNGVVQVNDDITRVYMDRGFAVMAFEGGKGRKLMVVTPDVEVEVLGTRFYVDARPGIPTTVGVVTGKVQAKSKKHVEVLEAGRQQAYRQDGEKEPATLERSQPYHSDAFLLDRAPEPKVIAAQPPVRRKTKLLPRKIKKKAPEPIQVNRKITPPPPPSFDPAETVSEAEKYAKEGDFVTALALIERALDTEQGKREPYRAMLRYTRARIMLLQGRRDEARVELGRLTAAPAKEVSIQAQLSLCELELKDDPCTAAACLKTIDTREARQLLSRWRLAELDCDQNNKSSD